MELNKTAAVVFNKLVVGLSLGESRTIDTTQGTFMPVHVEVLYSVGRWDVFLVAHYIKSHGDLVADPAMEFAAHRDTGSIVPLNIDQGVMGHYREASHIKSNGKLEVFVKEMAELVSFANMWMHNIASQQTLGEGEVR